MALGIENPMKMIVQEMEDILPGNPFCSDLFHMGIVVGSNVVIMYAKHNTEKQEYILICNTETGKRLRILLN